MRAASPVSNCGVFNRDLSRMTGSQCPLWEPAFKKSAFTPDSNIEYFMWPSSQRAFMCLMFSRREQIQRRDVIWISLENVFVPWR